MVSKLPSVPPSGSSTETVKRTTYTETTVKRVTTNHTIAESVVKPVVTEVSHYKNLKNGDKITFSLW